MLIEVVLIIFVILFAVIFHEYAHGWVANKLGDSTAKSMGRLTLNPLKHIDPVGTIVVPAVLKFLGFLPLGWAKPVPVNFANLNNPRRDMIWVAAAGPAVNIGFALTASLLLKVFTVPFLDQILVLIVVINLILAIFNLVPIPPLDGSRIVMGVLPLDLARSYSRLEPFGLVIVILLLNLGMLDFVWSIVNSIAHILGVQI